MPLPTPGIKAAVASGRLLLLAFVMGVAALTVRGPAPIQAGQNVLHAWIELGPGGQALARVVAAGAACPALDLDGRPSPMAVRAAPSSDFPVLVCEVRLPATARTAAVAGLPLALPGPDPQRMVVIGDTGCRMQQTSSNSEFQACNDPTAWPFAQIAQTAANSRPDLVIHVGDYHYREAACPAGNTGCAGSPVGDTWASWEADFFAPAEPLLRVAPWVMVRGNHESCSRAGGGWFRLLDPAPYAGTCTAYSEPYAVPLGGLQLLILDSSNVNDFSLMQDQVDEYRRELTTLFQTASQDARARDNAWLLTHDPFWVFGHAGVQNGVEQLFQDNMNLQAAAQGQIPEGLKLVLAGHIHLFQVLDFGTARPAQLVVGWSGTELDPMLTTPLTGLTIDGMSVVEGTVRAQQFGFATMEREGDGWRGTLRDQTGAVVLLCRALGRRLHCGE